MRIPKLKLIENDKAKITNVIKYVRNDFLTLSIVFVDKFSQYTSVGSGALSILILLLLKIKLFKVLFVSFELILLFLNDLFSFSYFE